MSQLFQDRLFEEHAASLTSSKANSTSHQQRHTASKSSGMDFTAFVDFVCAWENRSSPAAVKYFFPVFDMEGHGYLTQVCFMQMAWGATLVFSQSTSAAALALLSKSIPCTHSYSQLQQSFAL